MFFIYFSAALAFSIFVYIDSEKQQMPKWWSAVIFFAPITMMYYIIKTRQSKSLIFIIVFLLVSIVVGVGESFLYSRIKHKIIYSSYSPTAREVLALTDELGYFVNELNKLTLELEAVTSVDSSPDKISEVNAFIEGMRTLLQESDKAIKIFVTAINDNRNLLIEENFDWLLKIEEYYNEPVVTKYLNHLDLYLESFSSLLRYTGENFKEINQRNPVHLKNYDGYYMNYVRALESHNLIDVGRMRFQHDFLIHNPELKPYLPVILQKRFVNIWKNKS